MNAPIPPSLGERETFGKEAGAESFADRVRLIYRALRRQLQCNNSQPTKKNWLSGSDLLGLLATSSDSNMGAMRACQLGFP